MRLRYQLVVAILITTLMVSCFIAGREFQSLAGPLNARRGAELVSAVLSSAQEGRDDTSGAGLSLKPLETFQEVLTHLRSQYVSPIKNERDLTYGAIRGMLAMLRDTPYKDRYTRFMDPEEFRSFLEENEGHFGGIGAEIGVREINAQVPAALNGGTGIHCPNCGADIAKPTEQRIVVIAPLPDSPAERAGLQPGDQILQVGNAPTAVLGLNETVRRIKGTPGTKVSLLIARSQRAAPFRVEVARAVIDVRSVEHKLLPDRIGYLRISTFNDTTTDLIKDALKNLRKDGMRGLLLDLRNNAGGGLDVCVQVSAQFIGSGPVVYIQEKGRPNEARSATDRVQVIEVPLVVLINLGSASAAEILAGAIQDYKVGILVGVKTFGKGLVQTVVPLRDGSALALTTARYLTPKLRDIDGKGITPDHAVEQTQSQEYIRPLTEKDAQGTYALKLLREKLQLPRQAA